VQVSPYKQAADIFGQAGCSYLLTSRQQLSFRQAEIFLQAGSTYFLHRQEQISSYSTQQIPSYRQAAVIFLQAGSSYLVTGGQYLHRRIYDSPYFPFTIFRGSLIFVHCTFDNCPGFFNFKKTIPTPWYQ
jgi:hypothetical protein